MTKEIGASTTKPTYYDVDEDGNDVPMYRYCPRCGTTNVVIKYDSEAEPGWVYAKCNQCEDDFGNSLWFAWEEKEPWKLKSGTFLVDTDKEYKLLKATDRILEKLVQTHLEEGWSLHGPPFFTGEYYAPPRDDLGHKQAKQPKYAQAVVSGVGEAAKP